MRAVILAGGKGTRLAPYTTILPKPLMPIGDMPILEVVIRQLAYHRFDNITLAVGYLAELLRAYCEDGSKYNLKLSYSYEKKPLGTAGPISLIPHLDETFLVMNGDLLTTLNYSDMLYHHQQSQAIVTLATYQREVKIDLGIIECDTDNWVTNYIEKPTFYYTVSTGIYIFEPAILPYILPNQPLDLPALVLELLKKGEKVNTYPFKGYWLDIGRPEDYQKAIQEFEKHRQEFLPEK